MEKQTEKKRIQKLGFGLMSACFLQILGGMVLGNYGPYIFTDIAGIPYGTASACMFVVSALGIVNALVAGAQIQQTRSKMGQFRPWVALGSPVLLFGGLLMFVKLPNALLTTAIVSIGYCVTQLILNYTTTAEYGLQMKMAGDNSEARNTLASRYWAGINIAYIIGGFILVPMIDILGGGDEAKGFNMTHLILGALACVGMLIFMKISKPYDLPNKHEAGEEVEKVNFAEMVKGVIHNRPGRTLFLAGTFRVLAYAVLMALMAYQCEYVIGDMMAMSYFLAGSGILAVIANLAAPVISEKLGGRKKTAMLGVGIAAVVFAMLCFFGKTLWGFTIITCVGYFFVSMADTLEPVMYADAGEYYLNKTGKDTRAYMLSMSTLAAKIGYTVSTLVLGAVLGLIAYDPTVAMSAESANMLNIATGAVPAVCYALYVVILCFHGVSDKEIEKCIEENAEKYEPLPE